ncbi:hypothetical protein, partial [Achromobacter xylosoxidans]|uniref:hypothetical protein n=1 Tax=Alcaligenes xylosoxydans xylosoxydans TaxID=85698 RepID=UPI000AD9B4B8
MDGFNPAPFPSDKPDLLPFPANPAGFSLPIDYKNKTLSIRTPIAPFPNEKVPRHHRLPGRWPI